MIRVEAFDARSADGATAAAYCDLVASTAGWVPEGLRVPGEYLLNDLRHLSADVRKHVWLAYSGAALAGTAELQWWEAPDNRNRAWLHFEALSDEPLDALLDALLDAARSVAGPAGRTLLNVEAPEGSPVSSWVGLRGGTLGSIEEHNVTRLASLSRDDLASLARVPEGYELLVFDGPAPEEIVEPYVRLANAMNDAPRDDLTMEDWTFSTERLRAWEAVVEARGHDVWTVVARSASTGDLAGFNQLVLRPEWPESIQNEDTGVARAHRGHGLGLCVKAANLLRVVEERPSAVVVETWNAASNDHMLRVNRRLGFVCEHRWESWELTTPS